MNRVERLWWMGVLALGAVAVFWNPPPPVVFTGVPSVVTSPQGYRVFYDLVASEVRHVERTLRHPGTLSAEVSVLVLLSPREGLDERDRLRLLRFVEEGGTLLTGHPVRDLRRVPLSRVLPDDSRWPVAVLEPGESSLREVFWYPATADSGRNIAPVFQQMGGVLRPVDERTTTLGVSREGEALVTLDTVGQGRLIQLSDVRLLSNESIGFKRTHLMAAALLDEIGRDRHWAFDESHEGVEVQPSVSALLGAGPFRWVFLHLLLWLLFWYWWRSSYPGWRRKAPAERVTTDVASLVTDLTGYYRRGRMDRWALGRWIAYLRSVLGQSDVSRTERAAGQALLSEASRVYEDRRSTLHVRFEQVRRLSAFRRSLRHHQERKNS